MKFVTRSFRSAPNLSQEEALDSLQSAPFFRPGSKVVGIRPADNKQWLATVKLAGPFPPSGGDEGGEEDSGGGPPAFAEDSAEDNGPEPDAGGDDDSSPAGDSEGGPPKGEGEGKKPKEPKGDEAIIGLLQEILHALQGGAGPEGGMSGPDALAKGPSGMSAPPKGPPGAGGPPPGAGPKPSMRPMRPGEAPPGATPTGAPAFASTRQAQIPGQVAPAAGTPNPSVMGGGGTCPQCGGPEPCAMHGGAPQSLTAKVGQSLRFPTLVLSHEYDGSRPVSEYVKEARAAVEPRGYKVRQAKVEKEQGRIRLLATVR